MWANNLWEEISDIIVRRKIARIASLACFELKPDLDNPAIQKFKNLKIVNYHLCKILDKEDKTLCGFYNDDLTDFIPLNSSGNAFDFLEFFLHKEVGDKSIDELKDKLKDFDGEGSPGRLIKNCERANDNYLPFKDWQYVECESEIYKSVAGLFDKTVEQLWIHKLSFSNTFQLAELVFINEGKRVKNYALFKLNDTKDKIDFYFTLTGKSGEIYDVWKMGGFFLDKNNFPDYLKFFCWAIEGDEGKFLFVENINEIQWKQVPDKSDQNKPEEIFNSLKKPNPVEYYPENDKQNIQWNETDDKLKAKGILVYGNAIFESWFGINDKTGTVNMAEDNPLLKDNPINPLFFQELIPISKKVIENEIPILSVDEYPIGARELREVRGITTEKFWVKLKDGVVRKEKVNEKLTVSGNTLKELNLDCREDILIDGCWFSDDVRFAAEGWYSSITFKNCVFATMFSAKDCLNYKSLTFENCLFNDVDGKPEQKQGVVIDLENYRTEGDLIFNECSIIGEVLATTMKIAGNLIFNSCSIANSFLGGKLFFEKLMSAKIEESKEYKIEKDSIKTVPDNTHIIFDGTKLLHPVVFWKDKPILQLDNSFIKGNLQISLNDQIKKENEGEAITELREKLCNRIIGNFSAIGIEVRGLTTLYGTLIVGSLDIKNSIFHQDITFKIYDWDFVQSRIAIGGLDMTNCNVSGDLSLQYADIDGYLTLYSIYVESNIDIFNLKTNRDLDLRYAMVKGGLFAVQGDTFVPGREVLSVGGSFYLSAANIKTIRLEGILIKGDINTITGNFETVKITLGKNEDKFAFSRAKKIYFDSINVQGYVNLAGIHINKELKGREEEEDHDICVIRASQIGGDLKFFDMKLIETYRNHYSEKDAENLTSRLYKGNLSLTANKIGGYIDLRNLHLNVTKEDGDIILNNTSAKLNVNIESVKLGGDINAISKDFSSAGGNEPQPFRFFTKCRNLDLENFHTDGDIHLSGFKMKGTSNLINVKVSGWRFIASETKSYFESLFSRKRVIGMIILFLISVCIYSYQDLIKYPFIKEGILGILIIVNILFAFSFFCIHQNSYLSPVTRPYDEFFAKMDPSAFETSVYLDMEEKFKNENKKNHADQMYRALRNRIRKRRNKLFNAFDWLYGFFTGYGTEMWRLLVFWLALYFTTLIIFSNESSIGGAGENWDWKDGLLFSAKYCIPFSNKVFKENFYPSNSSLELIAFAIMIISWSLLSLGLYGIAAKLSRNRGE